MKQKKIFLIAAILVLLALTFSRLFLPFIYIALAAASKVYHRFLKSSIGIDLVLFMTLVSLFQYSSLIAFLVGFTGLILAEMIGTRFSQSSLISLFALCIVIVAGSFLGYSIPVLIALTVLYEIEVTLGYRFILGSNYARIGLFLSTHFLFNLFLIVSVSPHILS